MNNPCKVVVNITNNCVQVALRAWGDEPTKSKSFRYQANSVCYFFLINKMYYSIFLNFFIIFKLWNQILIETLEVEIL